MAGPVPVELSRDCASCGLEDGVIEVYDARVAACRFGVPAHARCRLCAEVAQGVVDRAVVPSLDALPANCCPACARPMEPRAVDERCCPMCGARAEERRVLSPVALDTREAFEAALDAWATRDGFASREELLGAVFVEPDAALLFDRRARGERLSVLADPFSTMGQRPAGRAPSAPREATPSDPTLVDDERPPPSAPPRAIIYPLVSVIAADGDVHPKERALVDAFLRSEGLAPLTDDELRVHHPSQVARFVPTERREAFVRLMCEAASADGVPDESERRVIRAYASAWDVPDDKVEIWLWSYENMNASLGRQLWLRLRRFVLSARWETPR